MKMKETFKKITIGDDLYFLHCKKQHTGDDDDDDDHVIDVKLTNGLNVFSGTVSKTDLNGMAKQLDMEADQFVTLFTDCFCSFSSTTTQQFVYQLEKDETRDDYEFVWKQKLYGGFKFQLGSLKLKKSIDPAMNIVSFFDMLTSQVEELSKKVDELQQANESLGNERTNITKRMENCTKLKETLEQDLYTKFSLVLNSKKTRIRELKKQIDEGPKISKKDRPHTESDQVDTDEEKEQNTKRKRSIEDSVGSVVDAAMDGENILLDDSIGDDDEMLPRKSRNTKQRLPRALSEDDYNLLEEVLSNGKIEITRKSTAMERRVYRLFNSKKYQMKTLENPVTRKDELLVVFVQDKNNCLIVPKRSMVAPIISKFYEQYNGENSFKLFHRISAKFVGISREKIQDWINGRFQRQPTMLSHKI